MPGSDRLTEESESIRRLMRDIVALVTLPAVWAGYAPTRIVEGFADVMMRTLSVDLIYARLKAGSHDECVEAVRSSQVSVTADQRKAIADAIAPHLNPASPESSPIIDNPLGNGKLRLAITSFGCTGDVGNLVVGSTRENFPSENDRLLLSIGANQTTVALQQKELERSLNDQRERLRVTLSSIGDAVITTDTSGRVTSLNPVAESLTGWSSQEAAGKALAEVFCIENELTRQPVTNPVDIVLAEGRIVGLANHTILIAKDGTEFQIDDSAAPIRDSSGTILGVVLIFRDIRERRRAEAAQAENMRLTALRADVSSAFSSTLSLPSALQHCCEALVRHLGVAFARIWTVVEKEEVLQLQASAGIYTHLDGPHSRIELGEGMIGRIASSGKRHLTNNVLGDPNISDPQWAKSERMVAFAGYPLLIDERAVGIVAMFSRNPMSQNVLDNIEPLAESIALYLERRETEVRLREETRITETLNRIGGVLAAELDHDSLVQAVTDEATKLTEAEFGAFFYNVENENGESSYLLYTLSGVAKQAFADFPMPRNTELFATTFSGGPPVRLDDVTRDARYGKMAPHYGMPEGHLPVVSYLAVPVLSRSGSVLGALFFGHTRPGVFTDRHEKLAVGVAAQAAITIDNAQLYQKALEQTHELREAARQKDEFLAMLAHELRNPLAPIRSGLDLLAMDEDSSHLDIILMMQEQVEHLVRLVDDLLDVSRIIQGKIDLKKEPVQLADLVERSVEVVREMIEANRQQLAVSGAEQPLWLDADPVRLVQVMENLLSNASKYTETGGQIEVSVDRQDSSAVIRVKDNGIGIETDLQPKIFDLFTQSERALDRAKGGMGIGLTLVRRLVQMHDGTVSVHSEGEGQGSTFTVTLPVIEAPESVEPPDEIWSVSSRDILVVDDNFAAAEMFSVWLKRIGDHQVRTAHDGPSALAEISRDPPEVVFLDIGLPGMDGYEVAAKVRDDPSHDNILLVALTGYGQAEDRRKADEAGFDEHLVKPPASRDLVHLFEHPKLVGGSVPRSQAAGTSSPLSPRQQHSMSGKSESKSAVPRRQVREMDATLHRELIHDLSNQAHMAGLAALLLEKDPSSASIATVSEMLKELQDGICKSADSLKTNTANGNT